MFDVVRASIRSLLNPELTASWEKGLTYVAQGDITEDEYMGKLTHFIVSRTDGVLGLSNQYQLRACYDAVAPFYKEAYKNTGRTTRTTGRSTGRGKAAAGTSRAKAGSSRGRTKKTAAE